MPSIARRHRPPISNDDKSAVDPPSQISNQCVVMSRVPTNKLKRMDVANHTVFCKWSWAAGYDQVQDVASAGDSRVQAIIWQSCAAESGEAVVGLADKTV